MARLGGNGSSSNGAAAPAASSSVSAQQEEDGRALYDVLADQVASMGTGEQLAMASALQRNDWNAIPEQTRALFRVAAAEFLDEGGV